MSAKPVWIAAGAVAVLAVGATAVLWERFSPGASGTTADRPHVAAAVAVKTVKPRSDPNFEVVAENPGYVSAYYRVDLEAQVPGVVAMLVKDIGDPIKENEEVLRLSVPDLAADVKVKEAVIAEKRDEMALAEKERELAQEVVKVAEAEVREARQSVTIAQADVEYRSQRDQRFQGLVKANAAIADVAAETLAESKKAQATATGAMISVDRALAEVAEATAKLQAAMTDISLKATEIKKAEADRDKAQAMLDFATLRAPFDGVIVRRMVDPGSFVSNSSSGHSDPLLTLERTDILTVYSNFPDIYAPYIHKGTKVLLEMSELPGVTIQGEITRFAPTLQTPTSDRTMRVEVDLYVGTAEQYQQFLKKEGQTRAGLKGGELPLPLQATASTAAEAEPARLMPGMYGVMRLVLHGYKNAYLLPSGAVFSRGGERYIYLIKDGKAVLTRVDVPAENGKQDYVRVIETRDGRETRRNSRPDDVVIYSNQGELLDGQEVKSVPTE